MIRCIVGRKQIQFVWVIMMISAFEVSCHHKESPTIKQQESWTDLSGEYINAHGAGVMRYNNKYYLYGEIKKGTTFLVPGQDWEDYRVPAGGISCYSSPDLRNWKNEGVVLAPDTKDSSSELYISKVIERPKVIYNKKTKKFVMWMHIDKDDYSLAHAGVAISDSPTGPFHYLNSLRPNGNMSRDMTLFQDDDDAAYLIYSSENNETMHVTKLSDDYLSPTTNDNRIFIKQSREAPAMFKYLSTYYLITSACTGWSPNQALVATSAAPLQDFKIHGNPCIGKDSGTTFNSQSAFIIPVPGKDGKFLFMADQWNKADLQESGYIWLPLKVKNDKVTISWSDKVIL